MPSSREFRKGKAAIPIQERTTGVLTVDPLNFSKRLHYYLAAAPEVAELIKTGRLVGVSPPQEQGVLGCQGTF